MFYLNNIHCLLCVADFLLFTLFIIFFYFPVQDLVTLEKGRLVEDNFVTSAEAKRLKSLGMVRTAASLPSTPYLSWCGHLIMYLLYLLVFSRLHSVGGAKTQPHPFLTKSRTSG